MKAVAVYSPKGGVGKTTIALHLAFAAATASARRTLLWDLDPQGAATFVLRGERQGARNAKAVFSKRVDAKALVQETSYPRLVLLGADDSLRGLNHFLRELDKKRRLGGLLRDLGSEFDRVILDCPPGITDLSDQVLRAADLIVVPVLPTELSLRSLGEMLQRADEIGLPRSRVVPVFNMVDRRKNLHGEITGQHASWPTIPCSSVLERVTSDGKHEISLRAGRGSAELAKLWTRLERKLARPV